MTTASEQAAEQAQPCQACVGYGRWTDEKHGPLSCATCYGTGKRWKYLRLPLLPEPRKGGHHESDLCPVCNKGWQPCAGSRLPCHGRCLLTDAGVAMVLERFRSSPSLAIDGIAAELGVPAGVVSSTINANGVRRR